MTISLTAEESESRSMPLEIEPITSAPSRAVQTEPRPPKRLVPAITGPAIASSRSSLPPEFWLTANRREAAITPPIAAIEPEIMKTAIRTRLTWIPARLRRLGVAADGEDVAAEAGAFGDELHPDHEAEQDHHRERHAAVGVEDRDRTDHQGGEEDEADDLR